MNKKRILTIVLITVTLLLVTLLSVQLGKHYNTVKMYRQLPDVTLLQMDSTAFCTSELKEINKSLVIFYFHPDCDFCQMEIESILKSQEKLHHTQLLFVSFALIEEIKPFLETFPIDTIPNVLIAMDNNLEFTNTFKPKSIPATYIYNAQGTLQKVLTGLSSLEVILKIITRNNAE
ncbi:hypothetical protein FACS1894201_03790 [Bacteroidia bacterium]|nr:hypothetical protein FACS1894201_03790 [Bacteroidia bacterium]